jgi:hypothetical protein
VVTGQRSNEESRELVANSLAKTEGGGRVNLLDAVQPSAVLEDESETATSVFGGGVHHSPISASSTNAAIPPGSEQSGGESGAT